jgi:ribosome maturation factor RimP
MSTLSKLREIVEPIVNDLGLDLYDLEFAGSTLTITVDLPPRDTTPADPALESPEAPADKPEGVAVAEIIAVSRAVGRAFDELDPIDSAYSIEVSSPGLERSLKTPTHFARAVGEIVTVKAVPGLEIGRNLQGRLVAADDDGITIELERSDEPRTLAYADIEKARTVFVWAKQPKQPKPTTPKPNAAKAKATADKPKQKKVNAP